MNIVICDDENTVRTHIRELIEGQGEKDSITELSSGEALLAYLQREKADIIFLDISMGGKDGMEAAGEFRTIQALSGRQAWGSLPLIVFTTGFPEYMPEAFRVNAFGFLIKPIKESELSDIYRRAAFEVCSIKGKEEKEKRIISLERYGCGARLRAGDILYIESAGHKSVIYLANGKNIEVYGRISDFEAELGGGFFRVHRCCLANLDRIERYNRTEAFMEDGHILPISRYKYQDFVKACLRQVTGI